MLTCREASQLCSEALDRSLGLRERLSLRMHLLLCTGCANFETHLSQLRAISRRYAGGGGAVDDTPPPDPPAGLKP